MYSKFQDVVENIPKVISISTDKIRSEAFTEVECESSNFYLLINLCVLNLSYF